MKTIIRNFLSILRRFKMATTLNILGLSVAFAAFMVIMMQLDFEYNFDRMHTNSDRMYRVERVTPEQATPIFPRPMAEMVIQSSPHILAGSMINPFGGQYFIQVEINGEFNGFQEYIRHIEPAYLDVFGFQLTEGTATDLQNPNTCIMPRSLAQRIFGSESPVGKQMKRGSTMMIVGGVYEDFPKNSVVKNVLYAAISPEENATAWGNSNYELYVRLDDPTNVLQVVETFQKQFDAMDMPEYEWLKAAPIRLTPLSDIHFSQNMQYDSVEKSSKQTLLVLLAIAFVIVIIAGINFTNFNTALAPIRIKSINTQKVLGGDERVIRNSLILEAITIAFVSFLISLGLIKLMAVSQFASLVDASIVLKDHPYIVGGSALVALVAGWLAGLYPSYYMTSFPPALVLKGSFGLSPKGRQLRNILIGIQFIASITLIIGASFMYLQNEYMQRTSMGYQKDELIVTNINRNIIQNIDAFSSKLKSYSGIDDVTYAEILLSTQKNFMGWGRKYKDGDIVFQCLPVASNFMKVMGIDITEGRAFRSEDEQTSRGTFIFNEKAHKQYEMLLGDRIDSAEVVGFMPDVKFASFHMEVVPMAFFVWGTNNWGNTPSFAYVRVKGGADMRAAMDHVRSTLSSFDPEFPYNVRLYDEILNKTYEKERNLSALITLFSLIAIFISIVGVFGLVVFESEYRKKEIGIRKVLGSTTKQILIIFNKGYIRILLICFVIAAPLAYYAIYRWLENFAYKTPIYWWVFVLAFIVISVITIFTVTFQNWRTANQNPVNSIKTE